MKTDKHTAVLIDCLDLLTEAPEASTQTDGYDLAQSIIDTLSDYPRPREKGDHTEPAPAVMGAYLYASTARNTAKLAQLNYMPLDNAFNVIAGCIEASLSLFID